MVNVMTYLVMIFIFILFTYLLRSLRPAYITRFPPSSLPCIHKIILLVSHKHVHALQLHVEPKICPSIVTPALIPYVMSPLYLEANMCGKGVKLLLLLLFNFTITTKWVIHVSGRFLMSFQWNMSHQIH